MGQTRIPGFCALCRSRCGSISVVEDGVFVRQEANPEHPTGQALCVKGRAAPELVYNNQRLTHPLRRTRAKGSQDPGWEVISWDEALDTISARLKALAQTHGPETVAFSTTSPSGSPISDGIKWIERLVNVFGSPNLARGTEICNWHKDFSHAYTFGRSIATPDFRGSGCIVLWGHNPSATWLDHATAVAGAKARGAALIVIDPRQAGFAARADQWLRVRPGADGALALSIANEMLKNDMYDREFTAAWTNGPFLVRADTGEFLRRGQIEDVRDEGAAAEYVSRHASSGELLFHPARSAPDNSARAGSQLFWTGQIETRTGAVHCETALSLFRALCARYEAAATEPITGVPAAQVRATAELMHQSGPVAYYSWSGISQHANATQTDRAIAVLMALTGSVDAPGGNVTLAKHPTSDISGTLAPAQLAKCIATQTLPLGPARKGWIGSDDLYQAILQQKPYAIRALMGFGANLVLSHASPDIGRSALSALEFFVQADVVMTPTAELADIVLPVNTPWEREALRVGFEVSQDAEELVQLRPAMVASRGESKSDQWIVFELAKRLGFGDRFWNGDLDVAYDEHLKPSGITTAELRRNPSGVRKPLQTRYRKYLSEGFGTPSGRIEIYSEAFHRAGFDPLPEFVDALAGINATEHRQMPLILTSAKIPHYCHSQHRHVASLRKRVPEPEASINPVTAQARDIENGEWIDIRTGHGAVRMRARFDAKLDPKVVVAQYGWWQSNETLGLPRFDIWAGTSANFNGLIDQQFRDPISGSTSHRAYPCDIAPVASEVKARRSGWRSMRIVGRAVEARGIASLTLDPKVESANLEFRPGQFISVRVRMPNGEFAVRNYSISSPGARSGALRISVKNIGAVSSVLNDEAIVGADIDIKGPFGAFAPRDASRHLVMLAGGIGITPFISILTELGAGPASRSATLFYGIRSDADFAFGDELRALEQAHPHIRVFTYLSDAVPGTSVGAFRQGFITASEVARHVDLSSAEFMLCGPPGMVALLSEQLTSAGVARGNIIAEAFGPASLPKSDSAPQAVRLIRSGTNFEWTAHRGSLLEQIEAAGVAAPSGCRAGQCGSCKVALLAGTCDHPEACGPIDPDECLTCVATPLSPVTLDL